MSHVTTAEHCVVYSQSRLATLYSIKKKEFKNMAKQLQFNEPARRVLLQGVQTVANGVKVTLGPRGRI